MDACVDNSSGCRLNGELSFQLCNLTLKITDNDFMVPYEARNLDLVTLL
jgi:hypothetical protein